METMSSTIISDNVGRLARIHQEKYSIATTFNQNLRVVTHFTLLHTFAAMLMPCFCHAIGMAHTWPQKTNIGS